MSFDEKDIELMKKIKNISDEEIEIPEVLSPENMMKTITINMLKQWKKLAHILKTNIVMKI